MPLVEVGGVELIVNRGIGGVEASVDVGGEAFGSSEHVSAAQTLSPCDIGDEIFKIGGAKAGVALGAYLFLIGDDGDGGALGSNRRE